MTDPGFVERSGDTTRGPGPERRVAGLCPACRHVKVVVNGRGSEFLLCRLASSDPRFRKYPAQPVHVCAGHEV